MLADRGAIRKRSEDLTSSMWRTGSPLWFHVIHSSESVYRGQENWRGSRKWAAAWV